MSLTEESYLVDPTHGFETETESQPVAVPFNDVPVQVLDPEIRRKAELMMAKKLVQDEKHSREQECRQVIESAIFEACQRFQCSFGFRGQFQNGVIQVEPFLQAN